MRNYKWSVVEISAVQVMETGRVFDVDDAFLSGRPKEVISDAQGHHTDQVTLARQLSTLNAKGTVQRRCQ